MIPVIVQLALGGWNIIKLIGAALKAFLGALNIQGWIGLVGCLALAFLFVRAEGDARHWKKQSSRFELLYNNEKTALDTLKANYQAAAVKAQQEDATNKARVLAQAQTVNQTRVGSLEARLADADARYERLQREAAAHSGGGSGTAVSAASSDRSAATCAPGEDGFSLSDRHIATRQAIQLDELIKAVRQIQAIHP